MAGTRSGAHLRVRAAGTLLLAVIGLGACEGDNLFKNNPPVADGPPVIKSLLVPESVVFEGDVIPVQVEAVARRGLAEVEIQYRGALNTDQRFGYELGTDSVVINTFVEVFQRQDSLLVVTAFARDISGRISASLSDTVRVDQTPLQAREAQ
jgi:hypothetical protein